MTMLIVAISLVVLTDLSVRLLLKRPIGILDRIVRPYAQGVYDAPVPEMPYVEFQAIGRTLGRMGQTIRQQINEVRSAEAKYRDIYENAMEGIFQTTPDGRYLSANPALVRIHGYDSADEFMASVTDIAHQQYVNPEDRLRFKQAIEERGFVERFETQMRCKNGETIWFSMSARAVRNDDGTVRCYEGTTEDITQRKAAEEALKQAKEAADAANRTKDQFLAVLSHELRTPLTPVLAVASSLEADPGAPASIHADMELVRRNVELETKLIDDLLDLTRITQGKLDLSFEAVDVHALLRNALATCQEEIRAKRLQIPTQLHAQQHYVWADQARLQQVFWNLIRNATKFTPERGTISVRSHNDGNRVQIQVADTGIGIEPEALPRIFNAFEQTERTRSHRFGGLGLGLAIAKSLVDLHKGRLTAESAGINQGATFTVELAVTRRAAAIHPKDSEGPAEGAKQTGRILLVEDSPDTMKVLSRLLRGWGYQVTGAGSVARALEVARQQEFDLLISDIGLPDGTGLEIMQQLRQSGNEMRGVALSGYGMDEDIEQSKAAGFEQHLIKPVTAKALASAVRQLVPAM
jgi:two-component system CheB/CheR fusion protein